jgi:hypothetical protein
MPRVCPRNHEVRRGRLTLERLRRGDDEVRERGELEAPLAECD